MAAFDSLDCEKIMSIYSPVIAKYETLERELLKNKNIAFLPFGIVSRKYKHSTEKCSMIEYISTLEDICCSWNCPESWMRIGDVDEAYIEKLAAILRYVISNIDAIEKLNDRELVMLEYYAAHYYKLGVSKKPIKNYLWNLMDKIYAGEELIDKVSEAYEIFSQLENRVPRKYIDLNDKKLLAYYATTPFLYERDILEKDKKGLSSQERLEYAMAIEYAYSHWPYNKNKINLDLNNRIEGYINYVEKQGLPIVNKCNVQVAITGAVIKIHENLLGDIPKEEKNMVNIVEGELVKKLKDK